MSFNPNHIAKPNHPGQGYEFIPVGTVIEQGDEFCEWNEHLQMLEWNMFDNSVGKTITPFNIDIEYYITEDLNIHNDYAPSEIRIMYGFSRRLKRIAA